MRAAGVEAVADAVVSRWVTPGFAAARPEAVERLRAMALATPREGCAGCCEAIAAMDLRDALGEVTAPTLALAGSADPATPPDCLREIAERVIDGSLVEVEAAHLANIEQPSAVSDAIAEHLGDAGGKETT